MRVESLGRRATFLVPSVKVYNPKYSKSRQSVMKAIHAFLTATFGGYTCASGNIYGYFSGRDSPTEYDELREFRVAFKEDDRRTKVPLLQESLRSSARTSARSASTSSAAKTPCSSTPSGHHRPAFFIPIFH